MDEKFQKQLIRQLRWLNIMVSFFGVMTLIAAGIIGFLLFQVIVFTRNAGDQIQNFRLESSRQFNVKDQACSDSSLGSFLRNNSDVCN